MARRYELWDGESRNLIWTYPTEDDALAQVGGFIREGGIEAVQGLALVRVEADERGDTVARDAALAAYAMGDGVSRIMAAP